MTRERMGTERAEEFDKEVRKIVNHYQPDGVLTLESVATITWGKPEKGNKMNELLEQTRAWVKEKGEKIANHLLIIACLSAGATQQAKHSTISV